MSVVVHVAGAHAWRRIAWEMPARVAAMGATERGCFMLRHFNARAIVWERA